MDRLQIAIQKARAQRSATMATAAAAPQHPEPAVPDATPTPPAQSATADAWDRLKPMDMEAKALQKSRLIATSPGKLAAPYDLLRTRMLHQIRSNNWRRIGVISPTAQCGKTTTVANLTLSCARQTDLRTLALDLDLRRPNLDAVLGQKVVHGMADVLTGKVDFADHGRRLGTNVAIGFNNGPARAPSELLQSRSAMEELERIETVYAPDLVLIDLPPMLATDDNFGFLGNVDAVLVMAAAEKSTATEMEVTLRQVGDLTQVLGIVLNKCRYNQSAYGYDSGYY